MDPLEELMDTLEQQFAGKTSRREDINKVVAEASSKWTETSIRQALLRMEADGRVFIDRPATGPYSAAGADMPTECRMTFCTVDEEA